MHQFHPREYWILFLLFQTRAQSSLAFEVINCDEIVWAFTLSFSLSLSLSLSHSSSSLTQTHTHTHFSSIRRHVCFMVVPFFQPRNPDCAVLSALSRRTHYYSDSDSHIWWLEKKTSYGGKEERSSEGQTNRFISARSHTLTFTADDKNGSTIKLDKESFFGLQ